MDMKKIKGMVAELYQALHAEDGKVVEEKEQYAREDDEGEDSDGDDADEGKNFKVKSMAAMLKKKMEGA